MSRLHESGEAVQEALKQAFQQSGLAQADWLLVFITPQHIAQSARIYETLQKESGTQFISGCSGLGVLSEQGEIFNEPGMVVMVGQTPNIEVIAVSYTHLRAHET